MVPDNRRRREPRSLLLLFVRGFGFTKVGSIPTPVLFEEKEEGVSMAFLCQTKTETEIKNMTVANVRKAYITLAADYNKIMNRDYLFCPTCNEFLSKKQFYKSKMYASGYYPECKTCLEMEVGQKKKPTDTSHETKESVQKVLRKMNLPYFDDIYKSQCERIAEEDRDRGRSSPFLQYVVMMQSLPQYKNKVWGDSEFGSSNILSDDDEVRINARTVKAGRRRFGPGFSESEYMFLENEYQDWITRYVCETKAQEILFQRICCTELDINNARNRGDSTDKLDKTLQDLMSSADVKPSSRGSNALTEAKTFGQLIDKWEETKPIPEPEPEFKDVDGIGKYIRVFFAGCLSKMFGWVKGYTPEYEEAMSEYSVDTSHIDDGEDEDSHGALWDVLYGDGGGEVAE